MSFSGVRRFAPGEAVVLTSAKAALSAVDVGMRIPGATVGLVGIAVGAPYQAPGRGRSSGGLLEGRGGASPLRLIESDWFRLLAVRFSETGRFFTLVRASVVERGVILGDPRSRSLVTLRLSLRGEAFGLSDACSAVFLPLSAGAGALPVWDARPDRSRLFCPFERFSADLPPLPSLPLDSARADLVFTRGASPRSAASIPRDSVSTSVAVAVVLGILGL